MRSVFLVLGLAACGEPRYVAQPLPPLIKTGAREPIVVPLFMPDGERLRWEVHHKGFTIGRAELVVTGTRIVSQFRTTSLASMFARASHDLSTTVDDGHAYTSNEVLEVDDERARYEVMFDGLAYSLDGKRRRIPGAVGQTMHTALGELRTWAAAGARPGFLMVLHAGALYRFDVDTPTSEDWRGTQTFKIDGRITDPENTTKPILVTLWVTADAARIPVRIALSQDGKQIDAETIGE